VPPHDFGVHVVHFDEPIKLNVPAVHGAHADIPLALLISPAGHA
jgi:hypothetical protein